MSNIARKGGLAPLEYLDGNAWEGKARMYSILASDASAYAIGDPVTVAGTSDANGVAAIKIATAATSILGAIVGFGGAYYGGVQAVPGQLESSVIPASKTRNYYVLVSDDPNIVYEIEEVATGVAMTTLLASAAGTCPMFLNYNLLPGANTGYASGWTLDNTSGGVLATKQVQVLGLVQRVDVVLGASAHWKVRINNHVWNTGVTGV